MSIAAAEEAVSDLSYKPFCHSKLDHFTILQTFANKAGRWQLDGKL